MLVNGVYKKTLESDVKLYELKDNGGLLNIVNNFRNVRNSYVYNII